jgi:hypothetical protein
VKINFAHIRHPSTSGGFINFAVFGANARNGSSGNPAVLADLTRRAQASGLRIDQSALAYMQNGQMKLFGDQQLVKFLSGNGVPNWTHSIDV